MDNQLLRYICQSHEKTPLEFLFLETGAIPIDYIIASRRISFLHEILSRNDNELIKRVFIAQQAHPCPGDFITLVKEDFQKIGETYDQETLCTTPKTIFKRYLKQKIRDAVFSELSNIQAGHSKVRDIVYTNFKIQPYLNHPSFSNSDCKILFALRSHSLRGIKGNFSSINKEDMSCPLFCDNIKPQDDQPHILVCKKLLGQLSSKDLEATTLSEYNHIYGSLEEQKSVVSTFRTLLKVRENLLEEGSTPASGSSLVTAPQASHSVGLF